MKPQDNKQHEAKDCPTCHVEALKAWREAAEAAKDSSLVVHLAIAVNAF